MQDIREVLRDEDGRLLRELRDTLIGRESPELTAQFVARRKAAEKRLESGETQSMTIREARRIGRNDPCPCGSNRKFKKCCGINFKANDARLKD